MQGPAKRVNVVIGIVIAVRIFIATRNRMYRSNLALVHDHGTVRCDYLCLWETVKRTYVHPVPRRVRGRRGRTEASAVAVVVLHANRKRVNGSVRRRPQKAAVNAVIGTAVLTCAVTVARIGNGAHVPGCHKPPATPGPCGSRLPTGARQRDLPPNSAYVIIRYRNR
jgi:hypothetical protein